MKVRVSEHARLDSFPLRYGFISDEFLETSSEIEAPDGTCNQKPREIKAGNKHIVCRLWTFSGEDLGKARVVLSPANDRESLPTIVTALSVEYIRTDRAVSEIVQLKRRRGEITPEYVMSTLHPRYLEKKLRSPEDLISIFVELRISEIEKEAEELRNLLALASSEAEALAKRNEDLQRENSELEIRIRKQEESKPNYRNEGIGVSPIATLKSVEIGERVNGRGETVKCTYLTFEEHGLPRRKMDEVFDRSGAITRKARAMIGKRVRTSTWKPEVFRPLDWFRDIYAAEI